MALVQTLFVCGIAAGGPTYIHIHTHTRWANKLINKQTIKHSHTNANTYLIKYRFIATHTLTYTYTHLYIIYMYNMYDINYLKVLRPVNIN